MLSHLQGMLSEFNRESPRHEHKQNGHNGIFHELQQLPVRSVHFRAKFEHERRVNRHRRLQEKGRRKH